MTMAVMNNLNWFLTVYVL